MMIIFCLHSMNDDDDDDDGDDDATFGVHLDRA